MGLGRIDKFTHSHGPAHNPHKVEPYFGPSVGVKPNTPKVENLESSGTPECLEFYSKAQNTLHWDVLGVIEKVLNSTYRKWHRISHLDICSPSYGQKKGRESKWQFDSRPLKVGNRPAFDVRWGSATRCWKDLDEGYKISLDLVPIQGWREELWLFKVLGVQPGHIRDNFGTPFWESWEKNNIRMPLPRANAEYTIGSKVVAYSQVRVVVSLVCPSARGKSQHPRVSRMLN
jgi:hypothetical protein